MTALANRQAHAQANLGAPPPFTAPVCWLKTAATSSHHGAQDQSLVHVVLNWAKDLHQAAPDACTPATMRFAWDGRRYRMPAGPAIAASRAHCRVGGWRQQTCTCMHHRPICLRQLTSTAPTPWRAAMGDLVNHWLTRDRYLATGHLVQGGAWLQGGSAHKRDLFASLRMPAPQRPWPRGGGCLGGHRHRAGLRFHARPTRSPEPPRSRRAAIGLGLMGLALVLALVLED